MFNDKISMQIEDVPRVPFTCLKDSKHVYGHSFLTKCGPILPKIGEAFNVHH
jgi:hypothetical protein